MIVLGPSGDLGELLFSFEQAGLEQLAQSWIGNGPNQPVSAKQLQTVFGEDQVQTMSRQSGMAPHYFLSQLSQHLPRLRTRLDAAALSPSSPATPTPEEAAAEALDLAFWNSVKDSDRREELEAYLEQHPNGHFAGLARARLFAPEPENAELLR